MIIKNYGRYWERKLVDWGAPGQRGHLKGYIRVRDELIDFRQQIGIYILHDKDLSVVYIGQTGSGTWRLFDRLKSHETDRLWNRWEHFSWFGFRAVNKSSSRLSDHDKITKIFRETGNALLDQIEGVLIAATEPKLNKQGARWKDADEFFQFIDDDMEPVSNNYLARRISELELKLEKLTKG